tara:strand:+ start:73 stop:666 length:594 start_codon:yes stop_codon:yes gene_type:complete
MILSRKSLQAALVLFGFLLILATYFLYPLLKQKTFKKSIVEKQSTIVDDDNENKSNTFENVEYKGIYNLDKEFTVKSEKAYILDENPEIVHMQTMVVVLKMNDGRIITITSDTGRYNKVTYDSYFVDNVKATDGSTIISSDNLDLIATKDFATAYNDVILKDKKSSLQADKVDYDFVTKKYAISMFDKEKIKIKLVQ